MSPRIGMLCEDMTYVTTVFLDQIYYVLRSIVRASNNIIFLELNT